MTSSIVRRPNGWFLLISCIACAGAITLAAPGCATQAPKAGADEPVIEMAADGPQETDDPFGRDLPIEIVWPEIQDPVFRDTGISDHFETDPWEDLD